MLRHRSLSSWWDRTVGPAAPTVAQLGTVRPMSAPPDPGPLEFRVEPRDGYVFVWQRGLASTVEQLEDMQRAIATAMADLGTRAVVFDNRETAKPDEWIRASMWSWLIENVDRAAMIQAEVRNVGRAERTGQRNRVAVGAFLSEDDARDWLLAADE